MFLSDEGPTLEMLEANKKTNNEEDWSIEHSICKMRQDTLRMHAYHTSAQQATAPIWVTHM